MKQLFIFSVFFLISIISSNNAMAICYPDIDSEREIIFQETTAGQTSSENLIIKNVSECLNTNDGKLIIDQVNIDNTVFEIKEDNCSNKDLKQGNSCLISLIFKPTTEGKFEGILYVPSNGYHEDLPDNPGTYYTSPLEIKIQASAVKASETKPDITDPDYSVNNSPSEFDLISPTDDSTVESEAVNFRWQKSIDPNGEPIDYYLFYCENEEMEECVIEKIGHDDLELIGAKNINYLFLAGTLVPFFFVKKKKGLLIVMILFSTFFVSCDDGKSFLNNFIPNISATDTEISFTASNLKSNTTYFWKVIAINESGDKTESTSWSFTVK